MGLQDSVCAQWNAIVPKWTPGHLCRTCPLEGAGRVSDYVMRVFVVILYLLIHFKRKGALQSSGVGSGLY